MTFYGDSNMKQRVTGGGDDSRVVRQEARRAELPAIPLNSNGR